ncbi:acyltransferase family protein [Bifidobacterium sp. ESL0682]|uniref:acyltransferase family protein n=1 Tax=Bifidobacterium sp. ESL0682 TaxID=2983212 RepID=UPI0023F92519|nr:acyltransferase family protein [Bifidobacterium sp. ESL0682]WEV42228.1 acyltransferase family protein [Bifidobacterium sp. ESL0682]
MRDKRLDVIKGLLIVSVVLGHALEDINGWNIGGTRALLILIYGVHMPAFIFLTGMFSPKKISLRKLGGLAATFLVFEIIYKAIGYVLKIPGEPWYWPYGPLWYLIVMIWWTFLIPLINRWPRATFIASLIGLVLSGLIPFHGNWFAIQRTFGFLPFYVLGKAWGKQIVLFCRKLNRTIITALVFLYLCGILWFVHTHLEPHWLFRNWNYALLGTTPLKGGILRFILLAIGICGTIVILSLNIEWPLFEILGQRSLAIFLGHVVVLFGLKKLMALHPITNTSVSLVVAVLFAVLAISLSGLKPVNKAVRKLYSL